MTQLRERLEVLEQTLADVGSPLLDHLRPGAPADSVTAALASRGIRQHPDLLTWYKTYPNVHKDFHNWSTGAEPRLSSLKTIRSTYAAASPRVGIYNVAYDIWLNGVPGNREVMIWTDNHNQVPAGPQVAGGVSLSGHTWRVYATSGNGYIAFVPTERIPQGTLRLKQMLSWLVAKGRVPARSTLGQICFGVEVVSTGGQTATFNFSDFSVTTTRK